MKLHLFAIVGVLVCFFTPFVVRDSMLTVFQCARMLRDARGMKAYELLIRPDTMLWREELSKGFACSRLLEFDYVDMLDN